LLRQLLLELDEHNWTVDTNGLRRGPCRRASGPSSEDKFTSPRRRGTMVIDAGMAARK
jgi:hypothetical protein